MGWTLRDLLPPDVVRGLIADGTLPEAAAPPAQPKFTDPDIVREVTEILQDAAREQGRPLTRGEVRAIMTDYVGRQPDKRRLERRGRRWRKA